jgi:hypothetical protein
MYVRCNAGGSVTGDRNVNLPSSQLSLTSFPELAIAYALGLLHTVVILLNVNRLLQGGVESSTMLKYVIMTPFYCYSRNKILRQVKGL